jgi:hypothetical protein
MSSSTTCQNAKIAGVNAQVTSRTGGEIGMGKVSFSDSTIDVLVKMSEGNPGALNVLMTLLERVEDIDPDAGLGGLLYVLLLDDLEIYGPRIWMLFKYVCGQRIEGVITLMRANQLGLMTKMEMMDIIDANQPFDCIPLAAQVREVIPAFKG